MMSDCKPVIVSRKRKAEPLAEQQSQLLGGSLLAATSPALLTDALTYARHFAPPAKRLLPAHSSASSSCGSLLDDSSRGEFSNGDACSELDFGSDAASRRRQRHETSLGQLTKKFVALLDQATDGEVNLNDASSLLKVQKRRIYDITNVLEGVGLLHKTFKNKIKWIGRNGAPPEPGTHAALAAKVLSNGRCNNGSEMKRNTLTSELRALEQREKDLDRKMHLAMNHLQQMTEDEQNKRYAFLTYLDIKSIDELSNQTVIAIKAPSETKLEVPDPREKLQMWLKSDKGEIEVYICPEHAPNNGSSVASNSTTSTTGNHTNHNSTNHHSHQSHSTNNSNHNNGSSNHHNASASTTTTTTQQQSNSNRVQTSINHSATCIDSSDQERGESLDSGLDSLHRSHSNTGHHSSSSNALKHAFISEDDDLGLMGARDLQMQTDDQAAINNAQHGKSGNASSGAGTGNASSATGVNNTSSVTNRQQSNCSPAPINDLLFLHLQPPLSEDDYNFALEDSEGIADLFGEMLPTYK